MELVYWSDRSFSRRGGDGVKGIKEGNLTLARCKFHFIREHENLVKKISPCLFVEECVGLTGGEICLFNLQYTLQ